MLPLLKITAFVVPLGSTPSRANRAWRITGMVAAGAFALLGAYLVAQQLVPGLPAI